MPLRDFPGALAPLRLPGRARRAAVAAIVGLACLPPSRAAAQRPSASASIVGVVRNRETHAPVPGAIARLEWTGKSVPVDSEGRFELKGLVPGPGLLQIRAIGYQIGSWAVNLAESTVVSKTFDMVEVPIVLPELTAITTPPMEDWRSPAGFEQRRRKGDGYFITEEQIKEQQPLTLAEVLRTVPGVYTFCNSYSCRVLMLRSTPPCTPEYFLDGFPASLATGPDFPIQGIRGIEIYGDVFSTPIEFQRLGLRCGVIAVWTRMGR
ncbi:MAG: TonB-dependent receptor plug domain-containing protein [Gemmatimonadales bacterium]|jgi:hypothetical protein